MVDFKSVFKHWWISLLPVVILISGLVWFFIQKNQTIPRQADPAVTATNLQKLDKYIYPLIKNSETGTYSIACTLEKLNFLKEGSYIRIGDFDVRVTGECSYLDVNREKQTALVALAVQNSVEGGTWMPNFVAPGVFAPSVIQESFETSTKIKPGMILDIAFNLPDANNLSLKGAAHHGRAVEQLYTQEEIKKFVRTKNPNSLNNKIIMPLSIARIWIFEE